MIDALRTSIINHFTTEPHNDFYNAVPDRLAYVRASQCWSGSYAIFFFYGFVPDDTFDAQIDDCSVQFSLFATTPGACGQLLDKCRALYHSARLSVQGHEDIVLFREMQRPPFLDGDDEKALWQSVIEFNFKIQKV